MPINNPMQDFEQTLPEKTRPAEDFELFTNYMGPNGTSTLYLIDKKTDQVIDSLDEALFGAQSEIGANYGVYAETCGGYAGQIHGAAYLNYDGEAVMYASSLDEYICECEECEEKGYEASTCASKDDSMIEYMDAVLEEYKLYWVEFYTLGNLAACNPIETEGYQRILEFLSKYINAEDLTEEALCPTEMQKCHMLGSVINK